MFLETTEGSASQEINENGFDGMSRGNDIRLPFPEGPGGNRCKAGQVWSPYRKKCVNSGRK